MERILLASSSPRRRELLESYGFPLLVRPAETDETVRDSLPVRERVLALARDKAAAALSRVREGDPRWVLAADTLVSVEGNALGKPKDRGQAREYIKLLSGKCHSVATGLVFIDRFSGESWEGIEETDVRFSALSDPEIDDYLDSREWEGAAGAYRIQGRAAFLIECVRGSFSCVVGLPLRAFYVILRKSGYLISSDRTDRMERPCPKSSAAVHGDEN